MRCHEYIEFIYKHPVINDFIDKIQPSHLQDDLKQEMAMVLFTPKTPQKATIGLKRMRMSHDG